MQTGKHLLRTQNASVQNQKHFFCPGMHARANGETFVSTTKSRQQCVLICQGLSNINSESCCFKIMKKRNILVIKDVKLHGFQLAVMTSVTKLSPTNYPHEDNQLQDEPQASQTQNTWCMRQLVYIENCMGKLLIVKKIVYITISFEKEFFYLKCVENLSLVLIFKPF